MPVKYSNVCIICQRYLLSMWNTISLTWIINPVLNKEQLANVYCTLKITEWDSSVLPFRRWTFRRWIVKCVFLWNVTKVQKFALPSSGKRVSAGVSLALVPDLSNYAVFIAIHDAYHGFVTAYWYTDRQPMARKYDIFLDLLWNAIKTIPTWKIKQ